MSVAEQTPYIEYTANGATTSFALGFYCESKDHLIVTMNGVEPLLTDWSLVDGAVVFNTAPINGSVVVIQRNTPFARPTDYQTYNNSFRAPAVNNDFDRIWLKLQELGVTDWILGNRIDALKAYVDDKDDELRAFLLAEIQAQGVSLDQLETYYNYLMQRLAEIAVNRGWEASFVVDANGRTQQDINNDTINVKNYGAIWNGNSNPVSDWYTIGSANYRGYADLAAVQVDYPFVTSGADEIDFVAVQKACNDALINGAEIRLPQGKGKFNKTINLTGFFGDHITSLPVKHNKRLRIVGKGSANTIIEGGEVGFGFFEMLGANFIDFEGLTLNATNATNKCQYGICAGRPTGNASSGTFHFKDFHIYGFFTKAAQYMMSSETNVWEDCFYYPQTGHGVVLAMNNIGWNVTPKYSTFGTGLGGNGVNYMSRVHFLSSIQAAASDILLAVEYGQVFRADTIYFASSNNEKHVQFRKAFGQTFINNAQHEKYGTVTPISYYFKGDDPADVGDYIDYRDFTLINSRLFQIYSEDNVRITNANIANNVYRGAVGSYGVDLAKLYDSNIEGSDKLANVTLNTNVKVRVRQENENNTWKGFKLENIDVPLLAVDHVVLPTDSCKSGEIRGLDTRNSAVQAGGAAPITAVGTGDFSIFIDFIAPSILDSDSRGLISFAGSATNMGSAGSFSAYFTNGALFFEYINTSSNVLTFKSTDANILQKLAGKRVTLTITRTGATVKAYINGFTLQIARLSLVGTASFADSINGTFLMFGSKNSGVTSVCKSVIISAALFNSVLSVDQVLNVHKNGALASSACIGLWDFTKSTAAILKSQVGADGSIYGDGILRVDKSPSASVTYDPPSLAAGAQQSTTVTLTGATIGSPVACSFSNALQGTQLWGEVTATNTVTVYHRNGTASAVDLASGTLTVKLI